MNNSLDEFKKMIHDAICALLDSGFAKEYIIANTNISKIEMKYFYDYYDVAAPDLSSFKKLQKSKLNYTADNNAITTQDLTDALLQASSVAKIAGMSFEDTIGVLTAMKEASGRTGKEQVA